MRPLVAWPGALESALLGSPGIVQRVQVLRETASTQDAARRADLPPGTLLVAGRQTAGRGRLGHTWFDAGDANLAMTLVLHSDAPERLSIAAAVGVANGVAAFVPGDAVGLKWPNDVFIDAGKVAGVLIESAPSGAGSWLVGIGVNVGRRDWPAPLAGRATSIEEHRPADDSAGDAPGGSPAEVSDTPMSSGGAAPTATFDRIDVALAILRSFGAALSLHPDALRSAFLDRDRLVGSRATLVSGDRRVTGVVTDLDPLQGLAIEDASGRHWMPAATTRVLAGTEPAGRAGDRGSGAPAGATRMA